MSKIGYSYDQILQHYYKGIKLATIPVEIIANNKTISRTFYSDKEQTKLIILNPQNIKNLIVNINDHEINVKLQEGITKEDISKYISKGINQISYTINDELDYKKSLKVYVEVKEAIDG